MNIATVSSTGSAVYLPAGARILSARGANADADTYTLQVVLTTVSAGPTIATVAYTYSGIPNGRSIKLDKDWPQIPNKQSSASAVAEVSLAVIPGTTGQVEVYYAVGTSVLDNPVGKPKVLSRQPPAYEQYGPGGGVF